MTMSEQAAKKWIVISALSVFGIWWFRRWREGPAAVLEAPKFIAAWGTVYFALSLVTEAAPGLGGSFSILVMAGDLLGNAKPGKGGGLLADITDMQAGKGAVGSAVGAWGAATAGATAVGSSATGAASAAQGAASTAGRGAATGIATGVNNRPASNAGHGQVP